MRMRLPSRKALLSPPVVVLALSLIVFLITLYCTHRLRAYNSDDISWQNILLHWQPFSGHTVELGGGDNFIDKVPLFALLGHFFAPSRKLLFLQSSLLAVASFVLFYTSSPYFLTKAKVRLSYINLLPFLWLASFGYSYAQLFLNPIWRGFELGVSFAIFALVAAVYCGDIKPLKSFSTKLLTLLSAVVVGLLMFSDPYFIYFTIGPTLVFSLVLLAKRKVSRSQFSVVLGVTLLGLGFGKIFALLTKAAGVRMSGTFPVEFISFSKLPNNIWESLHGLLLIFGADFFGKKALSLLAITGLVNFCILAFIAYKSYQQRALGTNTQPNYWRLFFVLAALSVFGVYTVSTFVNIIAYRYLVLVVLFAILSLALIIGKIRSGRSVIAVALILGICLNLSLTLSGNEGFLQAGSLGNKANSVNYNLIDTMRAHNLHKGYANYWQSTINTYLSGGSVDFLPVTCPGGVTKPFYWLSDPARFNVPADKSFYIIDADFKDVDSCTLEQITAQFGEPEETIYVTNKTILIYNHDLQPKQ